MHPNQKLQSDYESIRVMLCALVHYLNVEQPSPIALPTLHIKEQWIN